MSTPGVSITYESTTSALDLSYLATVPNNVRRTGINVSLVGCNNLESPHGHAVPLALHSLLSADYIEDFVGMDFFYRSVKTE